MTSTIDRGLADGASPIGAPVPTPIVVNSEVSQPDKIYRLTAKTAGFGVLALLFLIGLCGGTRWRCVTAWCRRGCW